MTLAQKLGLKTKPVFLMDGTAFIYRGFYANRHLRRADGFPTNAIVVVCRVLLRILRQENPDYFLFVTDGRGPTFRNDIYDSYKANREAMPEELAVQIEPIKRITNALGIKLETASGFEADDCIASIAARISPQKPVIIVSGDKDLKQCLGPNVFMWDPGSKDEKILTSSQFTQESGVTPAQWPDVQALVGDSSDNIPGVPGIGPKTARQIFDICPTLEDIRDHFALLPPKIQVKLESHLEEMFKWRQLTTLRLDACPDIGLENMAVGSINLELCDGLAREYELFSVRREIASLVSSRHNLLATKETQDDASETAEAKETAQAVMSSPPATPVSSTNTLPSCSGRPVAVIWPDVSSSPRVAVAPDNLAAMAGVDSSAEIAEYAWDGELADLCHWLNNAGQIIVADLKSLLVKFPSWRQLANGENPPAHFDLGLASYILSPEDGDYSWDRLALRWREPLNCQASGPAVLALAMAGALGKNLAANELARLYEDMEMPLVPVLAAMENEGIAIDPAAFRSYLQDVEGEAERLAQAIYEGAGMTFNLRSSQQLGEVLFGKLKLAESRRTRGGKPSTSQLALEKLAASSPVVENILQFRKMDKMRTTYLAPLPRLMDNHDRLHTTFNQEATATGRLSSSNPNLQNIPVRGETGKRMRACFIARKGNLLISADYSQIELRILAHLSQDPNLLEAFRNGEDIHARTAALVFDLPPERISPDQRRMAKTINFGLLYGMGAQKLAQELKIGTTEAKGFIERYFERLHRLGHFYDEIVEGARQNGFVTTMAGRKRWLPGIFSANGQTAAQAQRQAINTVIQGSAADVIKLAMLAVSRDKWLQSGNAALVLQVHDELLLEAPQALANEAGERVATLMAQVKPGGVELTVPLLADWGTGANWGEAH